jgi:maleate cis-trans isomerase
MSHNIAGSWRGVVGVIKPTHRPGSLEEFIRLLPEGIGVIPLFFGITAGTEKELLDVLEAIKEKVAELAKLKVDLIHPEGAPPFMLRGYEGEKEIVRDLEEKHGIPIVTSGMTQVEALRALGVKRIVGVTYFQDEFKLQKFTRYFSEAGFEVLGMEGIAVPFAEVGRLSSKEVYAFTKKLYLKHQDAQGIYMLGSGWRILDVIQILEQDLQVPVVHPIPARVWTIQKRLFVRQPVKGYGRLLEEMP